MPPRNIPSTDTGVASGAGPSAFVGRHATLRAVFDGVARGRSFVVYGGPKMGRTSVLGELVRQSRDVLLRPGPATTKQVFVYIDLATCATARSQEVASRVWDAVRTAVLDPYVQNHAVPPRPAQMQLAHSAQPWQQYEAVTSQLWEGMRGTAGWCRYILLLDGADVWAAPSWKPIQEALCNLVHADQAGRPSALVVAGGEPLRQVLGQASVSRSLFRPQLLTVLRDAEVETLLRLKGLSAEAMASLSWLATASGKHPYLWELLFNAWQAHSGSLDAQACIDAVRPELEDFFVRLLESFPSKTTYARGRPIRPEHALMQLLVEAPEGLLQEEAERALKLGPLKHAAEFLEFCGLLEQTVRGSSHHWRAPGLLWGGWYRQWLKEGGG